MVFDCIVEKFYKITYFCALMIKNKSIATFCALMAILLAASCKSEFERLRVSNVPEEQLAKAFEYYDKKEYVRAKTLFEAVVGSYAGRPESEKLYFYYAYTNYYLNEFITSEYYFKRFSSTFTNSEFREESDYMAAYSLYRMSPIFRLDQSNTAKAIDAFQLFINTYPDSERAKEANKLIDEMRKKLETKEFEEGQLYYQLENYQSAQLSFQNLLRDYPETTRAEQVRFLLCKSAYLLAVNSVHTKQEERFEQSVENGNEFIARYSGSKYEKEVKKIVSDSRQQIKKIKDNGSKNKVAKH